MKDGLLLVATCVLATLGFALIAFSQKQHRALAPSVALRERPIAMRIAGLLLIGASTLPAVLRDGLAFGLLLWTAVLSIAALLVVAGLTKLRGRDNRRPADAGASAPDRSA